MMSNDPDGVTPATRPSLRRDDPAAMASHPAGSKTEPIPRRPESSAGWRRIERAWWWMPLVVMSHFLNFSDCQSLLGTLDQRLWFVVSGRLGCAPGPRYLPPPRIGSALSIHVSPLCCGNACLAQPAWSDRVIIDTCLDKLSSLGSLYRPVHLASLLVLAAGDTHWLSSSHRFRLSYWCTTSTYLVSPIYYSWHSSWGRLCAFG